MSTVVVGAGGPRPQNAKVVSDDKGHRIESEDGSVLASGFSDADDARRYLAALVADMPKPDESKAGE